MRTYHITYMDQAEKLTTLTHWAMENQEWQKVKSGEYGEAVKVTEEVIRKGKKEYVELFNAL